MLRWHGAPPLRDSPLSKWFETKGFFRGLSTTGPISTKTMGANMMNVMRAVGSSTFSPDTPWTSLSRGASGGYGVLAGDGVYMYRRRTAIAESAFD